MSPQGIRVWVVAPVVLLAALAQAAPCVEVPVLFIVQDKSLSMVKAPDGSEPTVSVPSKWQSAATVVPSLAQQFENRFKFGVQMYPQGGSADTQCLPMAGGPVALVPSTAAVVRSTYAAAVPAGGTPTAVSLRAAKTYLQALATTSVKNVLLITDGMPNCNFGLDTANCQSTSPGVICPSPSCGSNICLDDANTAAAAGELRAIGIKVFVVGFGTSLTGGNNKAVLDAIAAAGGTSSSYSASNEATLAAALNSIAASTSTCCQDACTQGAKQCSGTGTLQSCQMDLNVGCTNWVSAACPTLTVCQSGACQPCVNPCTPGALRCTGTTAEQCVAVTGGCPKWTTADVCTSGEVCKAGVCTSCRDCTLGAARCVGTGVEECKATAVPGCSGWQLRACVSGSICQSGLCASCNQVCTAGSKRCNGKSVETCIADASGCTQWQQSLACGANSFCSGGQCGQCGPACAAGATRCNGNGTETCATDANGCPTPHFMQIMWS